MSSPANPRSHCFRTMPCLSTRKNARYARTLSAASTPYRVMTVGGRSLRSGNVTLSESAHVLSANGLSGLRENDGNPRRRPLRGLGRARAADEEDVRAGADELLGRGRKHPDVALREADADDELLALAIPEGDEPVAQSDYRGCGAPGFRQRPDLDGPRPLGGRRLVQPGEREGQQDEEAQERVDTGPHASRRSEIPNGDRRSAHRATAG